MLKQTAVSLGGPYGWAKFKACQKANRKGQASLARMMRARAVTIQPAAARSILSGRTSAPQASFQAIL